MTTQTRNRQGQSNLVAAEEARPAVRGETAAAEPDGGSDHFASARDMPAWAISLGVHLLILLIFGSITWEISRPQEKPISSLMEETDPDSYKFDATVVDQLGNDSNVNMVSPSQAAATESGDDPQKEMEKQLDEELLTVETPPTDEIVEPNEAELVKYIETTGATENPGGLEGSMDRLTKEIAGSLKERKTLVVWLFDASLSLKARRDAIADRFENVYKQLGMLDVGKERALKTAVASYGQETNIITPDPIDDVRKVVDDVRNIKPDKSGVERVFSAVNKVWTHWRTYRTDMRRNMMIIIVTDERGDDYKNMEQVIARLRRYGVRVYCVGNAAVFGRKEGYVKWTYEDGFTEEIPVDQGPETALPTRLKLAFWGTSGRDLQKMSAGFGPYTLTRLCAETGGLYLITEESSGPRFDPAVMRNYQPDYRPFRVIQQEVDQNRAKAALVQAAIKTQAKDVPRPQLRFKADDDNTLRNELGDAQKPFARFDYQLEQMYRILTEGEKDRDKLKSARWRASFDLAYGRVLAMRVRAYGYNATLAQMKAEPKPFQKKDSNMWRLVPSKEINAGSAVKRLARKATEYLSRVVDEHPDTPWAMLAERELSQSMGWAWKETSYTPQNRNRQADPDDPEPLLADEEEQERMRQQRLRQKDRKRPNL